MSAYERVRLQFRWKMYKRLKVHKHHNGKDENYNVMMSNKPEEI